MLDEYRAGRTPNPDIMCNQEVKFKLFFGTALTDGADMIATGHYAKTSEGRLFVPADTVKDQTYFLYRVTHEALSKTLFPLEIYTKDHVRKIAEKFRLATASKKDSQGICFVGSVGIREFLSEFVETATGNIIDQSSGLVVGQHDGAIFYTLGQRHGLELGGGMPYYVVGKDMQNNEVYVSRDLNNVAMWRKNVALSDIHWINDPAESGETVLVRMRHRGKLLSATLDKSVLTMHETERAVTPGQSVVIYRGNEVLGGGIVV